MMLQERKKKNIMKEYERNHQCLYITTMEVMEGICDDYITVYSYDKKNKKFGTWLFDIRNLKSFQTWDRTLDGRTIITSGANEIAYTPKYIDDIITLQTYKNITVEDILLSTKTLFRREDMYLLFNIKFLDEKEIEKIENTLIFP